MKKIVPLSLSTVEGDENLLEEAFSTYSEQKLNEKISQPGNPVWVDGEEEACRLDLIENGLHVRQINLFLHKSHKEKMENLQRVGGWD